MAEQWMMFLGAAIFMVGFSRPALEGLDIIEAMTSVFFNILGNIAMILGAAIFMVGDGIDCLPGKSLTSDRNMSIVLLLNVCVG